MILSIHQPSFFPWLGLLDKIAKSDFFVFLDNVAANKASNQYRNTFYCEGKSMFLSLPVDYRLGTKINELKFKNSTWKNDHLNKLNNYYRKADYFDEIYPIIGEYYYRQDIETPYEYIKHSMLLLFRLFNIEVKTIQASELECTEYKADLVLEICKKINTEVYLSGRGATNYMANEHLVKFDEAGIKITWHSFNHPYYSQNSKFQFIEGLSSLDMLFFKGIKDSNTIFWANLKTETNE